MKRIFVCYCECGKYNLKKEERIACNKAIGKGKRSSMKINKRNVISLDKPFLLLILNASDESLTRKRKRRESQDFPPMENSKTCAWFRKKISSRHTEGKLRDNSTLKLTSQFNLKLRRQNCFITITQSMQN